MESDPWLERWLPLIAAQATPPRVLELGCGEGRDTLVLLKHGVQDLTALDLSAEAVARCRELPGSPSCMVHDLRRPLPFPDAAYDVVLASLSLHYFRWPQTVAAVEEILRVLVPGGLLLCRVNSTHDIHYGAVGHPELEPHLYQVGDGPKRFFDHTDVQALFGKGWEQVSELETTIHRYSMPKAVWEVVLNKRE
jgi:SAM-dependent methyltransferase